VLSRPPTARADDFDVGGEHGEEVVLSAADERQLAVVGVVINRFLNRYEDTLRHTDHSLRCYLRGHYPGHVIFLVGRLAALLPNRKYLGVSQ
jgi:hypothetical protein